MFKCARVVEGRIKGRRVTGGILKIGVCNMVTVVTFISDCWVIRGSA
jgi:hypothetical protein